MTDKVNVWLEDIYKAIQEIEDFLPIPKDFNVFQSDLKTKRAVERNIGIIGEAINKIIKKNPDITISHTRKIIDTRNRIIHGYDSVSDEIIWAICIKHLPELKTEIQKELNRKS